MKLPSRSPLRRTVIDIGLTFGRQFLAGLMQLSIVLLIARVLGPEGAGTYSVALLLPMLMSQLLNLGLAASNVYFVASRQITLAKAWAASRDLMVAMSLIGMGLGALIVLGLGGRAFPGVPREVLLAALFIYPFSLLSTVTAGFFQALQDFRAFNLVVLVQPCLALLGIGGLWSADRVELVPVLLTIALSHALTLAVALAIMARRVPLMVPAGARREYLRPALAYGIKAQLSNIVAFLNHRLDLFLVNLLVGPAAAGVYTVALRLTEQLWMVSQAFSTVIFPRLSSMAGDEAGRRSFTPIMVRSVLWITLLGAGVLVVLAQPLILLLFGAKFSGAVAALLILLPGVVVLSGSRVLANDLAARGLVGLNLILTGVVLVVNTIANLILIPHYGILGAAAATTLAYTLVFIIRSVLQRLITKVPWWTLLIPMPEDLQRLRQAILKRKHS